MATKSVTPEVRSRKERSPEFWAGFRVALEIVYADGHMATIPDLITNTQWVLDMINDAKMRYDSAERHRQRMKAAKPFAYEPPDY